MLNRQTNIRLFFNRIPNLNTQSRMSCYFTSNEPFLKGFFHSATNDHHPCLPFLTKIASLGACGRGNGGFRTNVKAAGLTIKGCFDSQKMADQKAQAPTLAPHRQLLPDLDIGVTQERGETKLVNGHGACQRGSSFLFAPDHEKLVVAVDVDEVLGDFMSAINRFIADRYSLNHSVSEYHVYEFFKIWNCSRDEAAIRVHEFYKTPYFKKGIHPIPGAWQALHKLSRCCNLSVVTSRQNAIKQHTIEWIERHFPGLFQEIHFGNHFAIDGESRPKSEICRSFGAKVLIDDNPRYAIECAEIGIRVLLFDYENSYPWCKTESVHQHPLVTKVHNWEEVEQQILSWVQ